MIFPPKKETSKSIFLIASIALNMYLADRYVFKIVSDESNQSGDEVQMAGPSNEKIDSVSSQNAAIQKEIGSVNESALVTSILNKSDKIETKVQVEQEAMTDEFKNENTKIEVDVSEFESEVQNYITSHFSQEMYARYMKARDVFNKKEQEVHAKVDWKNEDSYLDWYLHFATIRKKRNVTYKKMFGPKGYAELKEIEESYSKEFSSIYGINFQVEI